MKVERFLFALLHYAICGGEVNAQTVADCTSENLQAAYSLAQKHDLAHMIAQVLEKLDFPDSDQMKKLKNAKMKAIYRYARMSYEYEQLCKTLEDAEIPYVPLKGSVLRVYYPEPWMRTSGDIDVLVHENDLAAAVNALEGCGWTTDNKRVCHDISLHSASGVHLELHFKITENMDNIDPVLKKVWDYSCPAPGKRYEYMQTNEYFLFHHIAHMSYHFIAGGCGIRPVLDLWILKNRMKWDEEKLADLLKEARLEKFYECITELMHCWFEGAAYSQRIQKMEDYILQGGTYGILSNKILVEQAAAGSSRTHLRQRILQPYDMLSSYYPILKRYKWLTPLFQVVRWIRVFQTGRFRNSVYELKVNQSISADQTQEIKLFLADIGLSGIRRSTQTQLDDAKE